MRRIALFVVVLAALAVVWLARDDAPSPSDSTVANSAERQPESPSTGADLANVDSPEANVPRRVQEQAAVPIAPRSETGDPRTVVVRVDPSSPFAGEEISDGDIMFVASDGIDVHGSADLRRAPVTFRVPSDDSEGWIVLRRDPVEFVGTEATAFLHPIQPGYESGVYEGRPGVRARAGDVVDLRLHASTSIRGSVSAWRRTAQGEPLFVLDRVRVLPSDAPEPFPRVSFAVDARERFASLVEGTGAFEATRVPTGSVRVELMRQGLVLGAVRDVVHRPLEGPSHPRLDALDLADHARRIRLTVVESGGEPIPHAVIVVTRDHGGATFAGATDGPTHEIDAWLPQPAPGDLEVMAVADGFTPTVVPAPHGSGPVVLEERQTCTVRASREFERDIGTHGFELRWRRVDLPASLAAHASVEVPWSWNGRDAAELSFPGPGRYELEVRVLQRMGSMLGLSEHDRFVGTGSFIDVHGDGETVEVSVPADFMDFDT